MIGKKKPAQKPSAAKNRQSVDNSRKSAPQNGSRSADKGAVSSKSVKKPPVQGAHNPQNINRNPQNNRVSQSRSGSNPAQNGSAKRKKRFVFGRKPKKIVKTANSRTVQNRPAAQPNRPAKPVNEQARRAADKAAQAKTRSDVSEKKRPYRGGNYTLYFILAAIVVGIVMAILSNTVLFKCGTIEVTGTTRYTAEEIIAATGIKTGDNLLHIDEKKSEDGVMKAFAFVDKVSVKKHYPTKIVVEITEAQNWFALKQDGKTVVISCGGRVLGTIPADGLVVVKGFEAESLDAGSQLCSTVDAKNKIVREIFETAEKVGLSNVTEIDITDRFSIKITVEGRIVLNIGPSAQLESKLRVGQALIEKEIADDEKVSVLLTNPEKVAVENLSQGQKPVQSSTEKPEKSESSDNAQDSSGDSSAEQTPESDIEPQSSTSD